MAVPATAATAAAPAATARAVRRLVVQGPAQVAFRVAAYRAPAPEDPFKRGLQQVLALVVAACQEDRGAQQVLALGGEEFLEYRDRLFAVHPAPLVAVTHQVRATDGRG